MKLVPLLLLLLIVPLSPALAGHHEGSSVVAFVQDYFDKFNSTTLEANPEQSFTFPAVFINDGKDRHKADDSLLSTSKVFYTHAMTEAGWKLVGASIPGGITLVE